MVQQMNTGNRFHIITLSEHGIPTEKVQVLWCVGALVSR